MKIKKILLLQLLFIFLLTHTSKEELASKEKLGDSWHFDTTILRNNKLTKEKLLHENFKEISLTTKDNIVLSALLLERKDAKCTIIFSHGF